MKKTSAKKFIGIAFCLPALIAIHPVPLEAEEKTKDEESATARLLSVNRTLLIKAEAEYDAAKNDESLHPSESIERSLKNLELKMKALNDDAVRLQSSLPKNRQANEFLRDLILRRKNLAPKTIPTKKETGPKAENAEKMHEQALQYVSEKRLAEAARLYEDIVLENPEDDEAYLLMGHTYLLSGNYEKAEMAFHNAVHIDPGNINEILPFYLNMTVQNPGDDTAFSNLGYACLIVGEEGKARDAFRDALGINPENQEAQRGLSIVEKRL